MRDAAIVAYCMIGLLFAGTLVNMETRYCPNKPRASFATEIFVAAIWPVALVGGPFLKFECK